MHYLLALILSISFFATSAHASNNDACSNDTDCIEVGRWDIGIALGYGVKSNPLKDFDDIPLYAAPTIAYYGDSWFFDNGSIGYTITEGENYTVNVVSTFSTDRAFFYRWDPSNIFLLKSSSVERATTPAGISTMRTKAEPEIDTNELENRNFTYLGGVEAFLYTRIGIVKASVTHDLFNVHNGTEAQLKWLYNIPLDSWNFEFAAVLDWKSEQVVDYYYGIRPSESLYWSEKYQAESALNQSIEFTGQYVLTENWNILLVARYTDLADEIVDSPLLDKDYTTTYFVGAAYRF
ncbi:MipA/OmpV family protein [Shewanella sp. Choline-02u-19]|jgi:outer membrane protein|uniref:MipA/OmpV family protein n=1 Tax=unclassified Shewanella TaxID=196818 RepID=UPI000C33F2E8|nr:MULTISPECIES: MipA/OmpV family protein [unclassified Shewanella]PKG55973.1 MipA/OmpV family protein [Shewanella sp. GutDb-MelDb]PKG76589.1 MipA/OmpV family protein [Shewanella sp. GutCb]PKH56221.1 MipA/OmpV family protein [Shewanella sp. Bg11-22]PKI28709.1 MipA/OmpV family protein [Shewanella sp. Choline-02u-19]